MHDQLIATYNELMQSLDELPGQIASAQDRLNAFKRDGQELAKIGEEAEHDFIARAGGWKALGANDKERELAVAAYRRESMYPHNSKVYSNTAAIDDAAKLVSYLERRYGAVCYQARLHAALLQYLGQAGAPVPAQPAPISARTAMGRIPVVGTINGDGDVSFYSSNKGGISAEDAALIGL